MGADGVGAGVLGAGVLGAGVLGAGVLGAGVLGADVLGADGVGAGVLGADGVGAIAGVAGGITGSVATGSFPARPFFAEPVAEPAAGTAGTTPEAADGPVRPSAPSVVVVSVATAFAPAFRPRVGPTAAGGVEAVLAVARRRGTRPGSTAPASASEDTSDAAGATLVGAGSAARSRAELRPPRPRRDGRRPSPSAAPDRAAPDPAAAGTSAATSAAAVSAPTLRLDRRLRVGAAAAAAIASVTSAGSNPGIATSMLRRPALKLATTKEYTPPSLRTSRAARGAGEAM